MTPDGRPAPSSRGASADIHGRLRTLLRVFCYTLFYAIGRHLPSSEAPYSFGARPIRYWLCRGMFLECGKNVNVEHGAWVNTGSRMRIGDNSGIGVNARVGSPVSIGRDVMMGPDVIILTTNHRFDDPHDPMNRQGASDPEEVIIGDDVWIGTRVVILPGVSLGSGSVVGAGAVVTKDVPDFAIVAGNPARIVGSRLASEDHS